MREIKFRAYINNHIHGTGIFEVVKMCGNIISVRIPDKEDLRASQDIPFFKQEYKLMQYTGVHDESEEEKEIYEGDKVKFRYESTEYIGIVKFEAGTFILACLDLVDSYITLLEIVDNNEDYWWLDGEVIGNIYEENVVKK